VVIAVAASRSLRNATARRKRTAAQLLLRCRHMVAPVRAPGVYCCGGVEERKGCGGEEEVVSDTAAT
jgi:hypothetical protein